MAEPPIWGVAAEFDNPDAMVAALLVLREEKLGRLDAFSPIQVPAAAEALQLPRRTITPLALAGAAIGAAAMFGLCSYATIAAYRFDIGGRPVFSWPAFVVPSVSFATLCGALVAYLAMLALSRLPRLNHPAFNIPNFSQATENRFFVAVEARDEDFDPSLVEAALARLPRRPLAVNRVPR
jgi:hypothetical protein